MERRKPIVNFNKQNPPKTLKNPDHSFQKPLKTPVLKKESFFAEETNTHQWTTDDPFKLGMAYLKNKNYESAVTSLQKNLEIEPDCLITRFGLGLSFLNLEKFHESVVEFRQLLLREPDNLDARLNIAYAYMKLEKYEQSIKEYNTLLEHKNTEENRKKLAYALLLLGIKQLNEKNYSEALISFLKSLENDKTNGQTYLKLGYCHKEMNNIPKAVESLEYAVKLCRDRQHKLECFYLLAELKISTGDDDEALKICREGSMIFPQDSKLNYLAGEIYFKKEEYDKALKKYSDVIKSQPNMIQALINIGQIFVFKNELDKALSYYFKVLQISPNNLVALCNISIIKYKQGEKEIALEQLVELAKFGDTNFLVYKYLGIILLENGKTEEAMEWFKKSIRLNPNDADNYTNLGVCFHRLKNHEKATIEYNKAINLAPNEIIPLKNLALLYFRAKKYTQAIELYERVLEIEPDNRGAFKNKAHCFKKIGEFETAVKMYRYFLKKNGFDSEALLNLGITYFEMGLIPDSREIFKKLTKSDNIAASSSFCYLSKIYVKSNDLKRAYECARNSVFLNVYNTEGFIQYANVYILLGKPDKAILCLKRALGIEPENEVAHALFIELKVAEKKEREVYKEEEIIPDEQIVVEAEEDSELEESDFAVGFDEKEEEKDEQKEILPTIPLKADYEGYIPYSEKKIVKTVGELKSTGILANKENIEEKSQSKINEKPKESQYSKNDPSPFNHPNNHEQNSKPDKKEDTIEEEKLQGYIPLVVDEKKHDYYLPEDEVPMLSDFEDEDDPDAIEAIRNFESDLNN